MVLWNIREYSFCIIVKSCHESVCLMFHECYFSYGKWSKIRHAVLYYCYFQQTFWPTLLVWYEWNDNPSSPKLCLPTLTYQAQSSQIHATCWWNLWLDQFPYCLLQELMFYSLWPLYFYTFNRPRAGLCLTGSFFCCLLVSRLISVSVSKGCLSCST